MEAHTAFWYDRWLWTTGSDLDRRIYEIYQEDLNDRRFVRKTLAQTEQRVLNRLRRR